MALLRPWPGILSRTLLRRLLGVLAVAWVLVHGCVAVLALLAVKAQWPQLPAGDLLQAVPDAWLAALPLTLPVLPALAGGIVIRQATAQRLLLAAGLAGRSPIRVLAPLLWLGAAASCIAWFCAQAVVPEARYRLRYPVASVAAAAERLAAATGPDGFDLGGLHLRAGGGGAVGWREVGLSAQEGARAVAVTARRLGLVAEHTALRLEFAEGRVLQQADGELACNGQFAALTAHLDAARLLRPGKQQLLAAGYYRGAELARVATQRDLLVEHGVLPTPTQQRRAAAAAVVAEVRLAGAALPLLALATVVLLLGRLRPVGAVASLAAAAAIAVGVLLQVVLQARVDKGGVLAGRWVLLLPAVAMLALGVAGGALDRRCGGRHG